LNILVLNQCFYPDVAATGQYATDLAVALARQGHEVTVIASERAYDDPKVRFLRTQIYKGIHIVRPSCTGFGKRAKWRRAVDYVTFYLGCLLRLIRMPRSDAVLAMTTPPLISFLAALYVRLRGGALYLWMMDLNPDLAVAAGLLRADAPLTKLLQSCLHYSLRQARRIVVLDRFMKDRIGAKGVHQDRLAVIPPWSLDTSVWHDEAGRFAFREKHGLIGKFVVMFSGNHSPYQPLETLLEVAGRLAGHPEVAFCFIGGGAAFGKVRRFAEERRLPNVLCLPYQPLECLSASLSAGDLHVVLMGDPFVGIVHPCKIYNILALGIPFLYIGPAESHITEMLPQGAVGDWVYLFGPGEVEAIAQCITGCAQAGPRRVEAEMRLAEKFSQRTLVPRFVDLLEQERSPALVGMESQNLDGDSQQRGWS